MALIVSDAQFPDGMTRGGSIVRAVEMGVWPIFFYLFSGIVSFSCGRTFKHMTARTEDLSGVIEQTLSGMGFEMVAFDRLPGSLLRVTIDTEKEGGVTVNDCEAVSNQLTALFTVEDIDYERLEVTSPGVERPLKKAKDWKRFEGSEAHVELFAPMHAEGFPEAGRRKLDGKILSVSGDAGSETVRFEYTGQKPFRTPSQAFRDRKNGRSAESASAVTVEFLLADVEQAHLIAELDFKGGRK